MISSRPIFSFPLFVRLWRVVGIDFEESVRRKDRIGDVGAVFAVCFETDTRKRRNQHGEVELFRVGVAVEELIVYFSLFDLIDMCTDDPCNISLCKE